jgi:hypothetical protein
MNNEMASPQQQYPAVSTERMAAFRQKAAIAVEVWQPAPGEQLLGVLVGHQKAVGTYGENYQILIQDERGNTTAAWLTAWLKENLRAQGAEKGDLVAITFLGKKQSPAGRPYNAYSLIVDKSAPEPNRNQTDERTQDSH